MASPGSTVWEGDSSAWVDNATVDMNHRIKLYSQGAISGVVIDEQTKRPIESFNIKLSDAPVEVSRAELGQSFNSGDGRFQIKELRHGQEYTVQVLAEDICR